MNHGVRQPYCAKKAGHRKGWPAFSHHADLLPVDYLVKLKGNEYVPPRAEADGNLQLRICWMMHDSVSAAPPLLHVRFVTSASVTLPLLVSVIDTLIVPARLGLTFRPRSA